MVTGLYFTHEDVLACATSPTDCSLPLISFFFQLTVQFEKCACYCFQNCLLSLEPSLCCHCNFSAIKVLRLSSISSHHQLSCLVHFMLKKIIIAKKTSERSTTLLNQEKTQTNINIIIA